MLPMDKDDLEAQAAALMIQKTYRMAQQARQFRALTKASVDVQRTARGWKIRRTTMKKMQFVSQKP